jgi:hypothetical protein
LRRWPPLLSIFLVGALLRSADDVDGDRVAMFGI